ncbi:CBS domain-containing protein [Roseomonas eburnea]|uniref:CBS domain-containing protein n=2 Tax=Neoroseomonas eburnea TaxID=1346889 RepID=A0A9X9X9B3_9PROT|nr:CBS domain-containing protein [Neoroseomonas eburnea]
MTTGLLTVPPDAPLHIVARLLAERGVSGAPVVDADGRLLGMVTEGDLIRRLAAKEDSPTSWVRGLLSSAEGQAARFARTHGRRARDVMTTELATVTEDTPIERVAQILESKGIRRVPVVRDGVLVGIVARADLIRALCDPEGPPAADAPDARIRRELAHAMQAQPWVDTWFLLAEVQDGVVTFHGFCRSETVKQGLRVLAEGIPGVTEVRFETETTPPYPG